MRTAFSTALKWGWVAVVMLVMAWPAQGQTYQLATGAKVQFAVGFMFGTTTGVFEQVSGTAQIEGGQLRSVNAQVVCESVNSQRGDRDDHLRTDHFFDCDKFPTLNFESTKVHIMGSGTYRVTGNLTMRGISHEVLLEGTLLASGNGYTFSATGVVDRQKWQISWNQSASGRDLLIKDEVTLTLEGTLNR